MDNKELKKKSALNLFYARGYDAVGVQEIVNTAGITKPTAVLLFLEANGDCLKICYRVDISS